MHFTRMTKEVLASIKQIICNVLCFTGINLFWFTKDWASSEVLELTTVKGNSIPEPSTSSGFDVKECHTHVCVVL